MSELSRIARELRQRLELDRLAGWDAPLSRLRAPAGAGQASGAGASVGLSREALLAPLRAAAEACVRCVLARTRTHVVFGTGDPAARVMFVGEGPGQDEDRQGEPFVGRAGRLLDDIIRAMGLRREACYIANVVKCRPPGNRAPDAAEIGACAGYLERQIEIVSPEVIVALGAVAAKLLVGQDIAMARMRNRFHDYRGIPVMPTYHPAYLLRYPAEKRKTWDDLQLVMARLGLRRP